MAKLYFVTGNQKKFEELQEIVKDDEMNLDIFPLKIYELQTDDVEELIKKKAFEAYKKIRRPLLVEHTMLEIDAFNQLPGPQTNYMYSRLGYKTIIEFCDYKNEYGANAESVFCYCDGKKYVVAKEKIRGRIRNNVKPDNDAFEWDIIFEPDDDNSEKKTFAKMDDKNVRSMRAKAWKSLKEKLGMELQEKYHLTKSEQVPCGIEPMEELKKLARLIKKKKVMLFIGAGISKSVDMPLWDELLKTLIGEEFDPDLFATYGDNLMLAEYIMKRKTWDAVYDEMCKTFAVDDEMCDKLRHSAIYQMIAALDCPVIYTTNYDELIEKYYDMNQIPNKKVVNINHMNELTSDQTRIMKFHGDINDKNSIVLAESEYFKRMDFQHFMDVQLQADMLRYHILFLGYSLSDINIKMLLYMARKRQKNDDTMESFIFTSTPNQVQREVFSKNKIITFTGKDADKKKGSEEFLDELLHLVKEA